MKERRIKMLTTKEITQEEIVKEGNKLAGN